MNLTPDLEIWTLILNASIVVKAVMLLLLAVSFMSWMFIFQKWFSIRRAVRQTGGFERSQHDDQTAVWLDLNAVLR